jgi:sigma-B regulation protein RsbU (phosphoserine phosphatase)
MDQFEPQTRLKVLIADDSQAFLSFLSRFLSDEYDVRTAYNGLECMEMLPDFNPEILLVDLVMPEMGGLEVIEEVRSRKNDQALYIIVLTGEDASDSKSRALNLGANDYLTKPFDKQELLARVRVAGRQVLLYERLHEAYGKIKDEMRLVSHLQSLLLPRAIPKIPGLDIEHWYAPSAQSSGDYYDYIDMGDGWVRLAVADVSGHGARAAFLMSIVRTLLRESARKRMPLDQAFTAVNAHLCEILETESDYVTLFAADLDTRSRTMSYLNAGHCPGLAAITPGEIQLFTPQSPPLGFFPLDFPLKNVRLKDSLELFLFTDGFYEWDIAPGAQLGLDRFLEMAAGLMQDGSFSLAKLNEQLTNLLGRRPTYRDDLTALQVKWSAGV